MNNLWPFWSEKRFPSSYENIYVRASREDWFTIIKTLDSQLANHSNLLDVGSGEGHTTKQILDRLPNSYECDLLEPNPDALALSVLYLKVENRIRNTYCSTLKDFTPETKYDAVYTSHTNYYWAPDEKSYQQQLLKFLDLSKPKGKALILTLPSDSDHYKIVLKPLFLDFVFSEYIEKFFLEKNFKVEKIRFQMRLFVGDILENSHLLDAKVFYCFIHNTTELPSDKEARAFVDLMKKHAKNGYLDFKDGLLTITR